MGKHTQLNLFGPAPAPSTALLNARVRLPDACKCGDITATIGAGAGPHCAELSCSGCGAHRGWLARETYDFIKKIESKFGCPAGPIAIRRGSMAGGAQS
jgi:hypothetical protein